VYRGKELKRYGLSKFQKVKSFLQGFEEKKENAEKYVSKNCGKLANRTMVGIILITGMMESMYQRMEGKCSESYQQKDRCRIE
jgi:hypothetical protein